MAQVLPAPCPEVKDDQAGHIFLGPCSEVKYDPEACLTIGQYEEKVTQNAAQLKAVHQQQQLLRESRERRHRQLAGIVSDIQKGEERMINLDTEEISLTSRLAEGRPHRRGSVLDQLWERAEERRASPQVEYVRILVPQRDAVVELDSKDTVVRWLVGATGATALWRVLRLPLAGSFLIASTLAGGGCMVMVVYGVGSDRGVSLVGWLQLLMIPLPVANFLVSNRAVMKLAVFEYFEFWYLLANIGFGLIVFAWCTTSSNTRISCLVAGVGLGSTTLFDVGPWACVLCVYCRVVWRVCECAVVGWSSGHSLSPPSFDWIPSMLTLADILLTHRRPTPGFV